MIRLTRRKRSQKPGFLRKSFVWARQLGKKPGFFGLNASFLVREKRLSVKSTEKCDRESTQKIKQKQQCDCHKPKHDFVNDIAPPLPKQPFLNLYLCEPNPTLHRDDSRAQHLAQ